MSENSNDVDVQVERLDSFLLEGLPEINQILQDYQQERGYLNVENGLLNGFNANPSNGNTGKVAKPYTINIRRQKAPTPLDPSCSEKSSKASTKESAPTQRMENRSSRTTFTSNTDISTTSSLETLCFLQNVQDMLNNIRDYADYISEYPLHRDDLLKNVYALLHYCHDICVGVPETRTRLPSSTPLYACALSSTPPTSSSSSAVFAPPQQPQMPTTSRGSLGATPIPRLRRIQRAAAVYSKKPGGAAGPQ